MALEIRCARSCVGMTMLNRGAPARPAAVGPLMRNRRDRRGKPRRARPGHTMPLQPGHRHLAPDATGNTATSGRPENSASSREPRPEPSSSGVRSTLSSHVLPGPNQSALTRPRRVPVPGETSQARPVQSRVDAPTRALITLNFKFQSAPAASWTRSDRFDSSPQPRAVSHSPAKVSGADAA